jgi:2,4-dienoyl-CoA reductase-like NADH-dependent reductase (Old Yellow Enzyme family)
MKAPFVESFYSIHETNFKTHPSIYSFLCKKDSVFLVGGMRRAWHMEEVLEKGEDDFICLARLFIRQPGLVKKFREGAKQGTCRSWNRCFAAAANNIPTRCCLGGFPV